MMRVLLGDQYIFSVGMAEPAQRGYVWLYHWEHGQQKRERALLFGDFTGQCVEHPNGVRSGKCDSNKLYHGYMESEREREEQVSIYNL